MKKFENYVSKNELITEAEKNSILKVLKEFKSLQPKKEPKKQNKPEKPITDEMVEKTLKGTLIEEETDNVFYVVNPISKKWIKKTSEPGKILNSYCK